MLGNCTTPPTGKLAFSLGCDFHFSLREHPRRSRLSPPLHHRRHAISADRIQRSAIPADGEAGHPVPAELRHGPHHHPSGTQSAADEEAGDGADAGRAGLPGAGYRQRRYGYWGPRSQNMAEWLLKRQAVHVIASDAHDPVRRTPIMSEARTVVAEMVEPKSRTRWSRTIPSDCGGKPTAYRPI